MIFRLQTSEKDHLQPYTIYINQIFSESLEDRVFLVYT